MPTVQRWVDLGHLKAWQSMLNLPCLADACSAADMRTPAHS